MRKTLIISALAAIPFMAEGQQSPLSSQYVVNKFPLSDAYAGFNGNTELFLGARQMWTGISGAPSSRMIRGNMPFAKNAGLGIAVSSDRVGIFNTFGAAVSYAYHIRMSSNNAISIGLDGGIIDHNINLSGLTGTAGSDPLVLTSSALDNTMPDAGLGILYSGRKLNFGLSAQHLLEGKLVNADTDKDESVYTVKRHLGLHASYPFLINRNWSLEAIAVARQTLASPLFYEITGVLFYQDLLWVGPTYRKGSSIGVNLGIAPMDIFLLNYTWETASGGIYGASGGSHEITLGILVGENNNPALSPFRAARSGKPYLK